MLNTIIVTALVLFIAIAIIVEHRLNKIRRNKDKKLVTEILQDTQQVFQNSAPEELAPTATGRQKVREMLENTKPATSKDSQNQSLAGKSAIKDTLVEQEPEEPPLPDPFESNTATKKE